MNHETLAERNVSPWLRFLLWMSILIAVAVVLRRLFALVRPPQNGPPQMVALDQAFESHAVLTTVHIVSALAFVLLVPFVLLRRPHAIWPKQMLFVLGAIVGITAYAMSVFAVGGTVERSAVFFFNSYYLYSLAKAYQFSRSGEPANETRWLTRAVWLLLGIATTRPVMGVFFATSRLTYLEPKQFFGIAFWVGFSLNAIGVELWLHSKGFQRFLGH